MKSKLTLVFTLLTVAACAQIPSDGLVGYWPFTGNANDESGNGNHGIVNGATLTTDRFGNANSAFSFIGGSNIQLSNNLGWMNSTGITISGWIYFNNIISSPGSGNTFFDFSDGFCDNCWGYRYTVVQDANTIWFVRGGSAGGVGFGLNGNYTPALNSWVFISAIIEGSSSKLFINGQLTNTTTSNTSPINLQQGAMNSKMLGTRTVTNGQNNLFGKLDDISIYNRALTPEEITQLYTDQTSLVEVPCTPFLGEDQTVCAGTSIQLDASEVAASNNLVLIDSYSNNVGSAWTHDFSAVPGQEYIVRVTAQFSMGTVCPNFEMDPAYWIPPYLGGVALTHSCNQAWFIQNYCDGSLGMRPTPDVYNPLHFYDYPIVANSNVVTVGFTDCCFGDNCGSISYEFYQSTPTPTYLWSTGDTTSTIDVTPTSTTTYWCTVTDANGNACTDSVTVFVPQIEATDLTICAGETTILSVSGINSTNTPSACPTLPANLQNGLVGYWPFCGNANDASGNGNNGTVNGATLTTDRFGNANSAYSFDGVDDYVLLANSWDNPNFNSTISIWAKPNNSILTGPQCFFYEAVPGEIHLDAGATGVNGILEAGIKNSGNSWVANYYDLSESIDAWSNYIISYNNNIVSLFINGNFIGQVENSSGGNWLPSLNQTVFGARRISGGVEHPFNGSLDEVLIFNRQLSVNEIQQLYTLGQTTYEWSTGDTTSTIDVSPTETTTYTCTINTNGVSCIESVTVTVQQPDSYYADIDNDGFGAGTATSSCAAIAGYVTNNTDCDDTNANINTAANEICNDIDDNCNSSIDEGLTFTDYYADLDNDGFGAGAATSSCVDLGAGYVLDNTDCDDTNAVVNPAAEDIAGNGIDENCDGQIDNSIAELANAFILYPNPASTNITLQVNSNLVGKELMIYDATGKLIHQQKILSTQTPIALSQMATGHYTLRIGEELKQFEIIK